MTKESLYFGSCIPRNWSRLLLAVVLLLSLTFPVRMLSAQETPKVPPFTPDPRLAEIIREVQKNEALYESLETVQRKVKQLKLEDNPTRWSITRIEEELHTVRQGELIYFHGNKTQTRIDGDEVSFERVSAFDGEQTRTIDYGICANIHAGRFESQYVYPPHCWALFDQRVNFPLSVLLRGTEAIHKHPKAHVYPHERGSIFEFNRFEAEYAGEEEVNGLDCVKLLCRHWYYTINDSKPTERYLWLAPERNYLCVKVQEIPRDAQNPPRSYTTVESFREIADGVWLPERVRAENYYYQDLREGIQTLEWEDTFELVEAKLNPGRPVSFFSSIKIPADLPVYHIAEDRLVGQKFRDRQPTPDSEERVNEIIEKIRAEEEKYQNLEVVSEALYRKPDMGIIGTSQMVPTVLMTELEHSIQTEDGQRWYENKSTSRGATGNDYKSREEAAFDGEWAKSFRHRVSMREGKLSESQYASLQRGNEMSVDVHLPHMLFQRYDWKTRAFSENLASPWTSTRSNYPHRIEYLGEDERDGLHCVVLREAFLNEETGEIRADRLIWLAVDRNYLPLRFEYYRTPPQVTPLPKSIYTVEDWREVAPGVWYPFKIHRRQMSDWGEVNIAIGRVLIDNSTTYTASKVVLDPVVDDDVFDGPEVPAGISVSVRSDTGLSLGRFEQEQTGPLSISEEKYVEMLNAANEREKENERRKQAMDALIGKPAPEIPPSKWLNGPSQTWDDLEGKVVVLDFWAIWCGPCRPDLERLSEHYSFQDDDSKAELTVIGVHTAGSKPADIEKVMKEYKVKYPVFIDPPPQSRGWGELFNAFEVHAIPQTFVVDADGSIAAYGRLEEMLSKAGQLVREERRRKKETEKPIGKE